MRGADGWRMCRWVATMGAVVSHVPEPAVPASSPMTVIWERLEEVGREITALGRAKGAEWEAHAEGECRGLEFALRALGVEL